MGENTYGYEYDPIGNREQCIIDNGELTITNSYSANNLNQYTSVSSVPSVVYPAHDADGNLIFFPSTSGGGLGGWCFQWDAENRLILASNATTLVRNIYDHRSRRIRKDVAVWDGQADVFAPQSSAHYLWDGWNIFRETVTVGSGSTQSAVTNYYTWGSDLSGSLQGAGGVGGLLSVTTVSTANPQPVIHFPMYDANGNITEYVATNGMVVARYEYDAFGATVAATRSPRGRI